jgi:hypothetical protein
VLGKPCWKRNFEVLEEGVMQELKTEGRIECVNRSDNDPVV